MARPRARTIKKRQIGGIVEAPRVIRRVVERPVRIIRSKNAMARLATLKRKQLAEAARIRQQTLKRSSIKRIQSTAKVVKAAKVKVAQKAIQARQVAPSTVRRRGVLSANERAAKLKNALNQRSQARQQAKQMAQDEKMADFVQAAEVIHSTQRIRINAHSYQLKQINTTSRVGADKQRACFDLHYTSFQKSLRAPFKLRKKRDPSGDLPIISNKRGLLEAEAPKRDMWNNKLQAEEGKVGGFLGPAQRAGKDAFIQRTNRDNTNNQIQVFKANIRLVSPDLIARQKQRKFNSDRSGDMSKMIDTVGRKPTLDKLGSSNLKKEAADSARRSEAGYAAQYDAAARLSREGVKRAEAEKAAAERAKVAEVTKDLPSISAKVKTYSKYLSESNIGIIKANKAHTDNVKLLKDASSTQADINSRISTTETAEGLARRNYDETRAAHRESTNRIEELSKEKDRLEREMSQLTKTTQAERTLAIKSKPTSSTHRTSELTRLEGFKSQINEFDIKLVRFKERLSALMEKRRQAKQNKDDNDGEIYVSQLRLADLRDRLASAKEKKPQAEYERDINLQRKGEFEKEATKQIDEIQQKQIAAASIYIHITKDTILESGGFKPLSGKDKNLPTEQQVISGTRIHARALKKRILRERAPRPQRKGSAEEPVNARRNLDEATRVNNEAKERLDTARRKAEEADSLAKQAEKDARDRATDKETTSGLERIDVEGLALYGKVKDIIESGRVKKSGDEYSTSRNYDQKRIDAERRRKAAEKRRDDADAARRDEKRNEDENGQKADDAARRAKEEEDAKTRAEKKGPHEVEPDPTLAGQKRQKAKDELDDAEDGVRRAKEEHAENQRKKDEAEGGKKNNDEDINDAENQLDGAQRDHNDADDLNDLDTFTEGELIKRRDELEKEIKQLNDKDIPDALRTAKSWYPHGSERRTELRSKVEEFRKKRDEAESDLDNLKRALEKLKAKRDAFKKMMDERDNLRKERDELTREYDDNLKKINDLEGQMKRALESGDTDLYNRLKLQRDRLIERNKIIKERLEIIRKRLDEIDKEIELRRLRDKLAENMKKRREEQERLKALKKKQDDHAGLVKRMRRRVERVGMLLGFLLAFGIPILMAYLAKPSNTSTATQTTTFSYGPTSVSTKTATATHTSASGPSGPQSDKVITTYPDDVQAIVNLLCKKGTSDYLKGCADGTVKGVADGKYDGTKDQIANYNRILPLTVDQIGKAVDTVASTFKAIEKEAYCIQIENEAQAAGLTSEQIFALYPECKVSSINGYGLSYGNSLARNLKPNTGTQSGGRFASSSVDYKLGWLEAYRYAYLNSYANAWAISKLNNKPKDIPIRPFPLDDNPKYGYGNPKYGDNGYGPTSTGTPDSGLTGWALFLKQLEDARKKAEAAVLIQRAALAAAEAAALAAQTAEATALSFTPEIVRQNFRF